MSKKIGFLFSCALVAICALSLFLIACGSSSSRPSGLLYVLTQGNNDVGNNISSFAIDLNSGNLSLINSDASTCPTAASNSNPEPCGSPLDILLDPTGATAFVLDQGVPSSVAATIYGYAVNSDGSLGTPSAASALAVGDIPVAMTRDAAGQFLFVLDGGAISTPANCPLAGAGCPSISVFAMTSGSTTLTLASGSPFYLGKIPTALSAITFPTPTGATPPSQCGFTTTEEYLFVTNSEDLSPNHYDNSVSVYCVSSSGSLIDLTPNPPYRTLADPLSVLAVNTSQADEGTNGGVFVYVGTQGSNTGALSIFQLCTSPTAPCTQGDVTQAVLLPVVQTKQPATGQNPIAMVVDPTNSYLYVLCGAGSNQVVDNRVFGFTITGSTGILAVQNPVSQPTGTDPVALAFHATVNNTGQFLFTSNQSADNISSFTLSTTTGAMSDPITVNAPATPSGMVAR